VQCPLTIIGVVIYKLSFVFGPFSQTLAIEVDFTRYSTGVFPGTWAPLWYSGSGPIGTASLRTRVSGDCDSTNSRHGDVVFCARLYGHCGCTLAGGRGIRSRWRWVQKLFQNYNILLSIFINCHKWNGLRGRELNFYHYKIYKETWYIIIFKFW